MHLINANDLLAKIYEVSVDFSGTTPSDGRKASGNHESQHKALPVAFTP